MSGVLGHTDHKSGIVGNNQHSRYHFEEWTWVSPGSVLGNGQMSWNFPQAGWINYNVTDKRLFYFATVMSDNPDGGHYYRPFLGSVGVRNFYSGAWKEEWEEVVHVGSVDTFSGRYWRPDNNNYYTILDQNYASNTYQLQIFIDDGNGNQRANTLGYLKEVLITTIPTHNH